MINVIGCFTLYAFTKRTNTGKNTDGGVVFELSPKNLTASSKASYRRTIAIPREKLIRHWLQQQPYGHDQEETWDR